MRAEFVESSAEQLLGNDSGGRDLATTERGAAGICPQCGNRHWTLLACDLYFHDGARWREADSAEEAQRKHDSKKVGPWRNDTGRCTVYVCTHCESPAPPNYPPQEQLDLDWAARDQREEVEAVARAEQLEENPPTPQKSLVEQSISHAHPGLFALLELRAESDELKRRLDMLEKKIGDK